MKRIIALLVSALFLFTACTSGGAGETSSASSSSTSSQGAGNKKVLIVYFSHTGNTSQIAQMVADQTGADLHEIVPRDAYPQDYEEVKEQAEKEQASGYLPPLLGELPNAEEYGMVFVGYPIWWGTYPPAIASFLDGFDTFGMTLVPFCTHGGSGLGSSVSALQALCPGAQFETGLAVRGAEVGSAQNEVSAWLREIGFSQ